MKSAAYWEAFEGHAEAHDAMEDGKHGARLIIASRIRDTMDQVKNVLGAHPDAKLTARLFYVELIWEA